MTRRVTKPKVWSQSPKYRDTPGCGVNVRTGLSRLTAAAAEASGASLSSVIAGVGLVCKSQDSLAEQLDVTWRDYPVTMAVCGGGVASLW